MGLAWWLAMPAPTRIKAAGPDHDKVKPVVEMKAAPFDLEDVRLLPGPFRHAMELDEKYLLALDVDRLLHNFRVNAGLPSSARPLGGWEEPKVELRGHFTGHFLTACALDVCQHRRRALQGQGRPGRQRPGRVSTQAW